MAVDIWYEKHLPKTIEEYVWKDQDMKNKIIEWVNDGGVPHLLLSGKTGLGKSALVHLILNLLEVPDEDICRFNASKTRQVDKLEQKIEGFTTTYPEFSNKHGIKYVILEEADRLSSLAQGFLREEIGKNVDNIRFILTCNYPERIDSAIIGRLQEFRFEALNQNEFVLRIVDILEKENVTYDIDTISLFVENTYPNLRKCIGSIQQKVINGVLMPYTENNKEYDFLVDAAIEFKNKNHRAAREIIISHSVIDEYPEIFKFMYKNLDLWSSDGNKQDDALLIIRDGVYKDSIVCDREINMSATLLELSRLS